MRWLFTCPDGALPCRLLTAPRCPSIAALTPQQTACIWVSECSHCRRCPSAGHSGSAQLRTQNGQSLRGAASIAVGPLCAPCPWLAMPSKQSATLLAAHQPCFSYAGNLLGIIVLAWAGACGHTPIALLGGATGRVGDPSGRSSERPVLSEADIQRNIDGECRGCM